MSDILTLACNTCEALGPRIQRRPGGLGFLGRAGLVLDYPPPADFVWSLFLRNHEHHELIILNDGYNPEQPAPGWTPTPIYGPPDSGRVEDQVVICMACASRNTVVLTVNRGSNWFRRCRACGDVWGPAVVVRDAQDRLNRRPSTVLQLTDDADPSPAPRRAPLGTPDQDPTP